MKTDEQLYFALGLAQTVEKVVALCKETHVPFTKRLTAARLGQALGKAPRAAVVLLDKNFMKMMI